MSGKAENRSAVENERVNYGLLAIKWRLTGFGILAATLILAWLVDAYILPALSLDKYFTFSLLLGLGLLGFAVAIKRSLLYGSKEREEYPDSYSGIMGFLLRGAARHTRYRALPFLKIMAALCFAKFVFELIDFLGNALR